MRPIFVDPREARLGIVAGGAEEVYRRPSTAMAAENEFPDDLKRFVAAHIDTVEPLEVLLLLHARPSETWTPRRVSDELRTSLMAATIRFERLCATGLCAPVEGGFRLRPAAASVEYAMQLVEAAYRNRHVSLISLIYARPPKGVLLFADAFRVRKGK